WSARSCASCWTRLSFRGPDLFLERGDHLLDFLRVGRLGLELQILLEVLHGFVEGLHPGEDARQLSVRPGVLGIDLNRFLERLGRLLVLVLVRALDPAVA